MTFKMQIEIDQSGKIEQTNHDTVIALTNNIEYAILIKKKDKRLLKKEFRKLNLHRLFIQITFATLISILLKRSKIKKSVLIDTEYPGYNDYIRKIIKDKFGRNCPLIKFGFVGKESKSDILALKVAHKKRKPEDVIKATEVLKIIFPNKKSGNA